MNDEDILMSTDPEVVGMVLRDDTDAEYLFSQIQGLHLFQLFYLERVSDGRRMIGRTPVARNRTEELGR